MARCTPPMLPPDEEEDGLLALPLLPKPRPERLRQQALGWCTILSAVAAINIAKEYCLDDTSSIPPALTATLKGFVFIESLLAIVCLSAIHLLPSTAVIQRDLSLPLPDEVAAALREGQDLPKQNIQGAHGSFCVRCLVWRPAAPAHAGCCHPHQSASPLAHLLEHTFEHGGREAHHCSTCQACVSDFSHHCGVLGRCIAGRGTRGNYKFFRVLVTDGYAATFTGATIIACRVYYGGGPNLRPSSLLPAALAAYAALWLWRGGALMLLMLWNLGSSRHCPKLSCSETPLPPEPAVVAYIGCCGICAVPVRC